MPNGLQYQIPEFGLNFQGQGSEIYPVAPAGQGFTGQAGGGLVIPYDNGGLTYPSGGPSIPNSQGVAPGDTLINRGGDGNVLSRNTLAEQQAAEAARVRGENINQINTDQDLISQSGQQAFNSVFNRYNTGARGLVDKVRTGQENIDRSRQNVELDKLNSLSGLSQQIRQGIQSGNIRLAAGNASDSSGADQLARAYQSVGTQQGNAIFNEAALGNRDIGFDQSELDLQASEGLRQLEVYKDEEKNKIGFDIENKLLALEEQAVGLGLNGQVEVQQMKDQIINEGIAQLLEVDNFLKQQMAGINPQGQDAIQAEAQQLRTLGRPQGFNFGDLTQSGPANTGFELPLLGARSRSEER